MDDELQPEEIKDKESPSTLLFFLYLPRFFLSFRDFMREITC